MSVPFVPRRVDRQRNPEHGPAPALGISDRSLQGLACGERSSIAPAKVREREPILGRGSQCTSQRVAIGARGQFAQAGREQGPERRRSPQIRGNAIEAFLDLLTDPNQCRETAARRFGHDLAKENWPAWPGWRCGANSDRTIACGGGELRLSRPQAPVCKSPTGLSMAHGGDPAMAHEASMLGCLDTLWRFAYSAIGN